MSGSGKIQILGVDGVDIISGGDAKTTSKEVVASNKEIQHKGNLTQTVDKDHTLAVNGTRDATVAGNDGIVVGNDQNETISRDWNHTVNGHIKQKVLGGMPLSALPNVPAYELELINGGITYILGDSLSGANPAALQSFNVIVNGLGGISFGLGPASLGNFNVVTALPSSVKLGATGSVLKLPDGSVQTLAVAPFGAALFEPFSTLMTTLLIWLDTHVHITAVGPSTPPVIPSSPIVGPMIPAVRSVRVAIGL
jgi:hypothetical protein